ncbi:pyridoxal phosphate-dependent aminotransferase [Croceicoccus sp. Ery5]|uniref:pyridoxal phosphate-dependent aminotransferase n=1 Tax=Croceicoccus sp. Ery5 TaxID=1703340 RepID=UPI001E3A7A9C|nr:pyridoxal phosphate-dependent aminotransferase [Croceicoccus sp. Ery5]
MATLSSRPPEATFSQWVRQAIRRNRSCRELQVNLFESSVAEPTELLRSQIIEAFGGEITTRYTSTFDGGNPYVVKHLAKGYGVSEDQLYTTTGATGAIALIYHALVRPGERVLVENPGFDLFGNLAHAFGIPFDRFQRSGPGFAIDIDALERSIGPATRLVVISNLHNPTGVLTGEDTIRALAALAEKHDLYVVVDEVYAPYAGNNLRPAASLGISPRLISVNSLTKIFGLSTLRCGWLIGDSETIAPIKAFGHESEFTISNLSHAIAALIMENPDPFMQHTMDTLAQARPVMESYYAHWRDEGFIEGDLPEFGCIAFPRLTGIADTRRFSDWLADRSGVLVAPGECFGAPGYVRLGFAMDRKRLVYGLDALTDGLKSYRAAPLSRDGA